METVRPVTMTTERFIEINNRLFKLELLEAAGVDKWGGYDIALEGFLPTEICKPIKDNI